MHYIKEALIMAIPEEIRKIERPTNTIVRENRNGGRFRYMVIERIGCKRVNGKNIPINGKTIGHIIDGVYVEGRRKLSERSITLKDWGEYALFSTLGQSILDELKAVYDLKDAEKMYTIALLRIARPDIPDYMLSDAYERSWLSFLFPNTALDKNTVSKLLGDIGRDYAGIVEFMRNRVKAFACDHNIAIDGTIKNDTSICNTFSKPSRKSREKGCMNISVLYAFDVETGEPICEKALPGNVIDSVAYKGFLEDNQLKEGVVLADKGFPYKKAKSVFGDNKKLHWLNPLKRNDKRIEENDMYSYTGCFKDKNLDVQWKKVKVGNLYLYSFYNRSLAAKEEYDYFRRHKNADEYDKEQWEKASRQFGTIVFESDLDLPPEVIYKMYLERWTVEECFRTYKQILNFDDTRVHSDASIHGTEFINFLSTCITMRVRKKLEATGLYDDYTYRQIMDLVSSAKKVKLSSDEEWTMPTITLKAANVLKTLGLIDEIPDNNDAVEETEETTETKKTKNKKSTKKAKDKKPE